MSMARAESLVEMELPHEASSPIAGTPEAFAKEMRVAAALLWYTQGRISAERAAEYAGLSWSGFVGAWAAARLPAFHLEADEMMEEAKRTLGSRDSRGSAIGNGPGEPSTGPAASGLDTPFAPEVAEAHYQPLGRIKGELAVAPVQQAAREFWRSAGECGARWLARRLRWEFRVDTLHAAAARLADLGRTAITPILEVLGNHPSTDQAWALLKALAWIGESSSAPTIEAASVELILARFLQDRDPDLREDAARAMRLLPPERTTYWLRRRQLEEKVSDVAQTIEEELTHLQAAGD